MKLNQICEGCGEAFYGVGIFCQDCAPLVKCHEVKEQPKFREGRIDGKRDRSRNKIRKQRIEKYAQIS